jgi:hypothetical protein
MAFEMISVSTLILKTSQVRRNWIIQPEVINLALSKLFHFLDESTLDSDSI